MKQGGAAVHTRYDQYSVIHTMELILGLQPLAIFDATATPMYDVFTPTPDNSPYSAIQPEKDLLAVCPCPAEGDGSASNVGAKSYNEALSEALPYNQVDRVPQEINDRILWQRVYGETSTPPPPGPNASRVEALRARQTLETFDKYRADPATAREELSEILTGEDDD